MNKIEILTAIVQEILPLEEKYGCDIFMIYSPHVSWVDISIKSFGWKNEKMEDYRRTIPLEEGSDFDIDACRQEMESHIIEQQSKNRDLKKEKIERLEKELEELRGEK